MAVRQEIAFQKRRRQRANLGAHAAYDNNYRQVFSVISGDPWQPRGSRRLKSRDVSVISKGQRDVVEPFHQPRPCVLVEVERRLQRAATDLSLDQVDGHIAL